MFCNLEHQLLHFYKNQNFPKGSYIYLAVSGGLDSMAMLAIHQKIAKVLNFPLVVIHIHHGELSKRESSKPEGESSKSERESSKDTSSKQTDFRNKAYKLVQEYCKTCGVEFISNVLDKNIKQDAKMGTTYHQTHHQKEEKELANLDVNLDINLEANLDINLEANSEADYRKYRYDYFEKVLLSSKQTAKILITAHTANDLLETRLMRLMRGVGPQGFLSIKPVSDKNNYLLVRPLLAVMRADLEDYVKEKAVPFCEDPSNQNTHFLRNWLRKTIFPIVEQKEKKYLQNMSKSLNLIANQLSQESSFFKKEVIVENKIKLSVFYTLSVADQKQVLAHYLYSNKIKNYSMGHVLELLKYLNLPQKEQSFFVAKQRWELKKTWLYILDNSSKSITLNTD